MRELYRRTFSQVHSSTVIRWEDMEAMRPKKKSISKNIMTLAAVIALLAALSAAAVAADWFGLRDLLLGRQQVMLPVDPETGERVESTVDTISLAGFQNSPENQAGAEWQSFLETYDDGGALEAIGNGPTGLEDDPDYQRFSLYSVYTREMVEKLKEITEKYNLDVHHEMNIIDHDELCRRVGGEFLAEEHGRYWAYIYDDGTFQFDGDAYVAGYGQTDYQLRRTVKGVFDEVILSIVDVSQYDQWQYRTACGETVLLALGPGKALILGDFPDCFLAVNVLAGTSLNDPDWPEALTPEDLETLADGIDFTVLKDVRKPEMTGDTEMEPAYTEDEFYNATGMQETFAQSFYCGFYQAVEEDRREDVADMIAWPRVLASEKGETLIMTAEEFLPYYDEIFTPGLWDAMSQNQYAQDRADLFYHDSSVAGAGGAVWFALVEDGRAGIITLQNPEGTSLRYGGGMGRNVAGVYTDTQGTDEVYSSLELCDRGDGTYDATISLYRLTTLGGMAALRYDRSDGMLYFTSEDQLVEAVIGFSGDTSTPDAAAATITYSEFDGLKVGDTFHFPDGEK